MWVEAPLHTWIPQDHPGARLQDCHRHLPVSGAKGSHEIKGSRILVPRPTNNMHMYIYMYIMYLCERDTRNHVFWDPCVCAAFWGPIVRLRQLLRRQNLALLRHHLHEGGMEPATDPPSRQGSNYPGAPLSLNQPVFRSIPPSQPWSVHVDMHTDVLA